jgi:bacterioferritin
MEFELAGVVRYTHYALLVTGPNRLPLVTFFKSQANESLAHAQQVGEILTGLDGVHPSLKIAPIEETHHHAVEDILHESFAHESRAVELYKTLLEEVTDASIYLEEFARQMISNEEMHLLELRKMQRDYRSPDSRKA